MSVWVVKEQSQKTFTQVNTGFDAVLGARGSKLQLVLNAIFHLEASPGNLSAAGLRVSSSTIPAVKLAIPIAVGDNLRGYRIVGTIPELFTDVEYAPGKHFAFSSAASSSTRRRRRPSSAASPPASSGCGGRHVPSVPRPGLRRNGPARRTSSR